MKSGTSKSLASAPQAETVVAEDLALEQIVETVTPERVINEGESLPLSAYSADYKPAATLAELDHHVHEVFSRGAESTEATDAVFARVLGPKAQDLSMFYKDVRVFRIGQRDNALASEAGDVESRMFGKR